MRIALGIVVLVVPAIAQVPMTIVPLFGAVGITAGAFGIASLIVWFVDHHHHRYAQLLGSAALFDTIPLIAAMSVGVGAMLFIVPILGLSFLIASVGALMGRARVG